MFPAVPVWANSLHEAHAARSPPPVDEAVSERRPGKEARAAEAELEMDDARRDALLEAQRRDSYLTR
jgi:hypothetical protein